MKTCIDSIAVGLVLATAIPLNAQADNTMLADATPVAVAAAETRSAGGVGCSDDAAFSPLQRRLLAKYDQGSDVLLQYVWITRPIHQLDRMETARWAEHYRTQHPRC